MSKAVSLTIDGTNVLKGIAIVAVVLIHVLSSIQPSPFLADPLTSLIVVALDQVSRICVPLFVALSGYGLFQQYTQKKQSYGVFLTKRIKKLAPLYLVWSGIFYVVFAFIPSWGSQTVQPSFLGQLLMGRADYHLYFVPMILQLYMVFPLIARAYKKRPVVTLLAAFLIQVVWWWVYSYGDRRVVTTQYFLEDREQYLWMTNWIAYFVLGMHLPKLWAWIATHVLHFYSVAVFAIVSTLLVVFDAFTAIQSGIDPLFALKFTRYPVLVYSLVAILLISYSVARKSRQIPLFSWLGQNSYQIYLGHTLVLRFVFMLVYML